jgi:hypothetical protein
MATTNRTKYVAAVGFSLALIAGGRVALAQSLPPGYALKPGFPKQLNVNGHTGSSAAEPVWANLGLTAGRKSIIIGTSSKELYVVNYDGSVAPGWPQPLPGEVRSSAAVGDLDGDGLPDIVVGFGGGGSDPTTVGGVRAFKRDGTVLWTVNGANESGSSFPLGVVSTPAIGDIDGDGHNDVVWGSFDGHIYAVDGRTGVAKAGWPLFVRDTIWSSPALYDIDGDGKLEIIIGTDSHADPTANPPGVPPTIAGGRLHVLTYLAQEYPGFPKDVDEVIISSPVVGDIDGDGRPEIIHGTGTYYSIVGGAASSKKLYAWKCDGTAVPGWPVTTTGRITGSPALADLDGDGVLDVIVSEYGGTSGPHVVAAYKGNVPAGPAQKLWETTPLAYSGFNLSAGQPVVADVLNDGKLEVLVSTNSEICILSNTGVQLTAKAVNTTPSLYMPTAASSAALDVDNGILNIAAASQNSFASPVDVTVYAWTTPKTTPAVWSAFRYDARRLGVAPNAGACAPRTVVPTSFYGLTPCRVIDTRVGSGPLGGPPLAPMAPRNFNVAGVCGIPSGAVSISANVTVTNNTGSGELVLFPSDVPQRGTSTISFRAFRTRANNSLVYLAATTPTFSVYNNCIAPVDFVLDVNGYFQ